MSCDVLETDFAIVFPSYPHDAANEVLVGDWEPFGVDETVVLPSSLYEGVLSWKDLSRSVHEAH